MHISPRPIIAAGVASLAASIGAAALAGRPANAAAATVPVTASGVSENWAGYIAQGRQFSSVSGSWVQPAANCTAGSGDSAFWVGLGGTAQGSGALEQAGTQSNCTSSGQTEYYAWYELLPAAPVRLDLAVKPGDRITTQVSVSGTTVTVNLRNTTTGASVSKALQTSNIDTSSAEWIAEAPSLCTGDGSCQTVPLANFGSVKFTNATAAAAGHTGPISDASWQAQQVQLDGSAAGGVATAYDTSAAGAAQTSALSNDGSAFTVAWQSAGSATPGSDPTASSSGSPYGGDGGYGYGGYGYGGDSYGYGDGGYTVIPVPVYGY